MDKQGEMKMQRIQSKQLRKEEDAKCRVNTIAFQSNKFVV